MSNLKKTITLSGGLHYHFKALRYKSQWQDFRHSLNAFLKTWNPQSKKLTIVGPSGGYCLETEFLNKFQSVSCYDLDPLAKWFFSFNHKTKTQWFVKDFFKHMHEDHQCLLFSNLLGQIPATMNSSEIEAHNELLKKYLKHKSWASFHDVYSWYTQDQQIKELQAPDPNTDLNTYLKSSLKPHSEVIDHQTQDISNWSQHKSYFLWPLTPKRTHLIECCFKD